MGKGHVIIHGNDVMGNQAGGISLEGCENAEVLFSLFVCVFICLFISIFF